jgi:two-component system, sporulation sensor kinase D
MKDEIINSDFEAQLMRFSFLNTIVMRTLHDMRHELSYLNNYISSIHYSLPVKIKETPKIKYLFDDIMNTSDDLSKKISLLYDFYRPSIEKNKIDIVSIINSLIDLIKVELKRSNIKMELLFDTGYTYNILGFNNDIQMILFNIIQNSLESFYDSTNQRIIKIEISKTSKHLKVIVSDTGVGIPKNDIENVFNPYFTTKKNKAGLGLYFTKKIIENNYNGEINISSESYIGTITTLTFSLL